MKIKIQMIPLLPPMDKINPRTYRGERGFLLECKTSAPDVFSSCLFISRAHFKSSSVMVSFYGYEI